MCSNAFTQFIMLFNMCWLCEGIWLLRMWCRENAWPMEVVNYLWWVKKIKYPHNTTFHGFFSLKWLGHLAKIRQHDWKEPRKISKVAKFENDLLKTKEDIAPQSREILQMFVWWGASSCPLVTNVCKILRLCRAISSLSLDVSPLNLVISNFKLLFPAVSMDIRLLLFIKSWKKKSKPLKCLLAISCAHTTHAHMHVSWNHFLTHFVLLSDREAIIVWPLKVWTLEETCA